MQNKLQELTDKLYQEGLSKGKQEAEQLKATAKSEAASIIAKAKAEAAEILENAKKEAKELETKTQNDIKMASNQAFVALKQEIVNLIITNSVKASVKETFKPELIKEVIKTVAKSFNAEDGNSTSLNIILAESQKEELEKFVKESIAKECNGGLEISFSKNIASGFKIGPKEQGYMISFTDKDFQALISEYLRPKTKTLLFG